MEASLLKYSPCLQVIDDFVRESPDLSSVENKQLSTATIACDTTLNLLASSHSMSKNNPKLKAKVRELIRAELHILAATPFFQ